MSRLRLRMYSAGHRGLPDFLMIGTERGGTSSLYKYLGRHPEIAPSLRKETEYFNRHYDENIAWYRAHFPLAARHRASAIIGKRLISFEATPTYLQDPRVPARVAELLPEARLIVLLRNPISRALSGWRHMRELGFESMTFEEALRNEKDRTAGELERMMAEPYYFSRAYHRFSYLDRGKYAEQLERWFEFFPRDRFLVLESEDFYRNTGVVYSQILRFLGVQDWTPDGFKMYSSATSSNPAEVAEEVSPRLRQELEAFFEPHNRRLVDLLERTFSWCDS